MIRTAWILVLGELRLQLRQPLSVLMLLVFPALMGVVAAATSETLAAAGTLDAVEERAQAERAPEGEDDSTPSPVSVPPDWEDWLAEQPLLEGVPEDRADAVLRITDRGKPRIQHEVTFTGMRAYNRLRAAAQARLDEERDQRLQEAGLDPPLDELLTHEVVDRATAPDRAGATTGAVLPGMLMFSLVLAGLVTALDVFTGEKERRTIESLLTTGADRRAVALAKLLAVSLACFASGVLFLGALAATQRVLGAEAVGGPMGAGTLAVLLLTTLVLAFQVAGAASITGIYADDYKTASMISAPVMFAVMTPAAVAALPVPLDPLLALVPVANVALATRELLAGSLGPGLGALVLLASATHVALSTWAVWRMLEQETALIGGSALGRDGQRTRGGQALAVTALGFCGLWFFGQTAQAYDIVGGTVFTMALFAGTAVASIAWLGLPVAETLSLRLPSGRDAALAVLVGALTPVVAMGVFTLQEQVLPVPESLVQVLAGLDDPDRALWLTLLVFALAPGVCEELLFRGAILGLQRFGGRMALAVGLNALAFGLMHIALHRWLPTATIGLIVAVAVWRSRSVLVGMWIHTVNNALALTLPRLAGDDPTPPAPGLTVGLGLVAAVVVVGAVLGMRGPARDP